MTAKSKYEKDACWGTGPKVDVLRHMGREKSDRRFACQACGAEAVTAGYGRYTDMTIKGVSPIDVVFLCRACHPAHAKDVEQVTDVPGYLVVQTYCTTTGNVIGKIIPTADIPKWTAPAIWYLPDDLPPIDQMPPRWVEAASEEYGYLWRKPEVAS